MLLGDSLGLYLQINLTVEETEADTANQQLQTLKRY
jgi:hypothetical protein